MLYSVWVVGESVRQTSFGIQEKRCKHNIWVVTKVVTTDGFNQCSLDSFSLLCVCSYCYLYLPCSCMLVHVVAYHGAVRHYIWWLRTSRYFEFSDRSYVFASIFKNVILELLYCSRGVPCYKYDFFILCVCHVKSLSIMAIFNTILDICDESYIVMICAVLLL